MTPTYSRTAEGSIVITFDGVALVLNAKQAEDLAEFIHRFAGPRPRMTAWTSASPSHARYVTTKAPT